MKRPEPRVSYLKYDLCISISEMKRRPEAQFSHSKYVCEWYHTISNLPLICIGIFRLIDSNTPGQLTLLYHLLVLCGVASFIHHALDQKFWKFSIVFDWAPILISLGILWAQNWIRLVSLATWLKVVVAFFTLGLDHLQFTPVPWGHSFWHVLAGFAADSVYQDVAVHLLVSKN